MKQNQKAKDRPRPQSKKRNPARALLWTLIVLCVAAYGVLFYIEKSKNPATRGASKESSNISEKNSPAKTQKLLYEEPINKKLPDVPKKQRARPKKQGEPPLMAIILDDVGYDADVVETAMSLGAPITFAVLPYLPRSEELAREIHKRGFEVWLHLPLEPKNYPKINPGEGAILTTMTRDQAQGAVIDALKAVPYIKGVNTHMGSHATTQKDLMKWALEPIKSWGLFFVDSKTTPETVAYETALAMGISASIRDVFLDTEQSVEHTLAELKRLEEIAIREGTAIGIGHFYPSTLSALKQFLAGERKAQVVFASEVIEKETLPLEL